MCTARVASSILSLVSILVDLGVLAAACRHKKASEAKLLREGEQRRDAAGGEGDKSIVAVASATASAEAEGKLSLHNTFMDVVIR